MPAQSMETLYWEKTIPAYILDFLEPPAVIHFSCSVLILLLNAKLKNEGFHKILFSVLCTAATFINSIVVNTVFSSMNGTEIFIYSFIYLFACW